MSKKTKTKSHTIGNASCTRCGLRASSKNVAIRHVFPCWPEHDSMLSYLERAVRITSYEEKDFVRVLMHDEQSQGAAMAMFFKSVYDHDPDNYESNVEKLLCAHTWKQDKGTAIV